MHGSSDLRPTVERAAVRPPIAIKSLAIDPATRAVSGPTGSVAVEPRIMQVLLELIDAEGAVVTRDALLERCWSGALVGEDALNRAVSQLRKALREIGSDVTVATIARAGYRLSGLESHPDDESTIDADAGATAARTSAIDPKVSGAATEHSRRWLIGGFVAAGTAGATALLWPTGRSPSVRQADALVERGDLARRDDLPDSTAQGIGFYREALKLAPDAAATWGKLALALASTAEYAPPGTTATVVGATEQAAKHALAIDPGQADARVALAMLSPDFGEWLSAERRLRQLLATASTNLAAQSALALVLMEVGRVGGAAQIVEGLVAAEPLSPGYQYRHAYQLWAQGRLREADRVADRALQLWPRHPSVWLCRLWTFALSGRAAAALAMLDAPELGPGFPPPMLGLLRKSCVAVATRTPAAIAAAVDACAAAALRGQFGVVNATLVLPELGAVEPAYQIMRGYLLREGPVVGSLRRPTNQPAVNQQGRRKTMMLWMPSAAPLRADPRFWPLCRDAGLVDYWRQTNTRPDFLGARPLPV